MYVFVAIWLNVLCFNITVMVSKYLESVIIGAGVGQSLIFPSKLSLQFAPYVHTVKKLINHPYKHSSLLSHLDDKR